MSTNTAEINARSTVDTNQKGTGKARLLSLDDLDGRTRSTQAALALRDRLIAERGGECRLGAIGSQLITDIALLSVMISHSQTRWLCGEDTSLSELCALINCRRRLLESPEIGILVKPATPSENPNDVREVARAIKSILEEAAQLEAAEEATQPHQDHVNYM